MSNHESLSEIEMRCIFANGYCPTCHEHFCEHSSRVNSIGLNLLSECLEWRDNELINLDMNMLYNIVIEIIGSNKGKLKHHL